MARLGLELGQVLSVLPYLAGAYMRRVPQKSGIRGKALLKACMNKLLSTTPSGWTGNPWRRMWDFLLFPAFFAYFKVIYHTMESGRCRRDSDGWKFLKTSWWNLMTGAVNDDKDGLEDLPFDEAHQIYTQFNQLRLKTNPPQ